MAALLASKNFTSTEVALEGKNAWANVLSTSQEYSEITTNLGKTYEISLNTYKPFACGIVIHPAIDACIQLRNEHKLTADQIERIDLRVHPLVLELTGKKTPQTGLETKFSVFFAAAIQPDALEMIVNRNGKPLLGAILADNVLVERLLDRAGTGNGRLLFLWRRIQFIFFKLNDAYRNAVVADVDMWRVRRLDEFPNFLHKLMTERAADSAARA